MPLHSVCKSELHASRVKENFMQNMCISISLEDIYIKSSIMDQLISSSSCFFSLVMYAFEIFSQGNVHIGTMPLYRCFKIANLDTPHDQPKFRMQFWHMKMDSHAVSHFMELWRRPKCQNSTKRDNFLQTSLIEKKLEKYLRNA